MGGVLFRQAAGQWLVVLSSGRGRLRQWGVSHIEVLTHRGTQCAEFNSARHRVLAVIPFTKDLKPNKPICARRGQESGHLGQG